MSGSQVAVLGYGNVGSALATALLRAGHRVTFATNPANPGAAETAQKTQAALAAAEVRNPREAVSGADLVILALPFAALDQALPPVADLLVGTTVIDATNPVGPNLTHALGSRSGAQHVADLLPGAHVVKAFNVYGAENLSGVPTEPGETLPLMPFATDDSQTAQQIAQLLTELGWEPLHAGPLDAALDLEHLALMWIRYVRVGGNNGNLVWAARRWQP